jgi:energy-coupling factor transport system ATP-binding protein
MAEPVLELRGLSYRYPEASAPALAGVDLRVERGEFVLLVGRSGSGKSTLLQAACGLVPHYQGGEVEGELAVAGLDVRLHGPAELAAGVGYLAQDPEAQVTSTTPRAEIGLPLELRGVPAGAHERAVEEVALALGIAPLLRRSTDTLSGGELQKVALAAALAPRPALLLLDEATSQLDPVAGDELVWLLRRLNEEWGVAVILAEHRVERCLAAADRVVALEAGAIAYDGAPGGFQRWALDSRPELATPAALMFDLAGLEPLPVSVRQARRTLAERGISPVGAATAPPARVDPEGRSPRRRLRGPRLARRPELALSARELWVELGEGRDRSEALQGLELEIERGERVALMGRNGAGKSTLLRAAAGLIDPSAGSIGAPAGAALLPQRPADMLLYERIADELPGNVGEATLELLDLARLSESDPRDISGGERQRLALAVVIAGRGEDGREPPGLLMLDEPTRGLDRGRKADLASLAGRLASRGAAVLIATHEVEFAAAFAERVVLLGEGELLADGPPEEVLSGGWYFATEVARVLGREGVIAPEPGAREIRAGART